MMENLGCKGTQARGDCNIRPWNGSGSCIEGGYPCINCTAPRFEEPGHAFAETPKIGGIPIGLPTDMPKPVRRAGGALQGGDARALKTNAVSDRLSAPPVGTRNGHDDAPRHRPLQPRGRRSGSPARREGRSGATSRGRLAALSRFRNHAAGKGAIRRFGLRAAHLRHLLGVAVRGVGPRHRGRARADAAAERRARDQHHSRGGEHRRPPHPLLPLLHAGFRARGLREASLAWRDREPLRRGEGSATADVLPARAAFLNMLGILPASGRTRSASAPAARRAPSAKASARAFQRFCSPSAGFWSAISSAPDWKTSWRSTRSPRCATGAQAGCRPARISGSGSRCRPISGSSGSAAPSTGF